MEKYFIAIVPPEPVLSDIQRIKQKISETYQTKGALRSPGHITLHMPFSFEQEKEEKLINCLSNFKFSGAFSITLNHFACFAPRVVYIRVEEQPLLYSLQKQLVLHVKQHLQLFNQSDDKRGFLPHVTVAFRDLKKQNFHSVWEAYKTMSYHADFVCHSFVLLKHFNQRWEIYKEFNFEK